MRRFYLRIYLALLASLAVFAVLAGLTAAALRLAENRPVRSFPEPAVELVERLLPPGRDPALLSSELAFWSERTGLALALVSPNGEIIASAGELPPNALSKLLKHPPRGRVWRALGGTIGLTLSDGRRLIAISADRRFSVMRLLHFPAILLGIAFAVAIGFYPLIRRLLRRLEQLEAGVARFGEGNLAVRVPVKGRDEIAKLAATFNASASRIETLMNAHRLLLAHASHELRSPLSRLRMAMERLKQNAGDSAAQAEAARNIGELDTLIGEILLSSRLQSGQAAFEKEPVDIAGLLAEECAAFGVEVTVPNALTSIVQGDAGLLRRLFRNLLENAAAHGGPEPPEVRVIPAGPEVRVLVCDRGPGVPEGEREKIFEPFYRLRGTKGSGAGLGLALVRQIGEQHGGQVLYSERTGGGACFEVSLPAREALQDRTPLK
jgi:signal transduction histidine kinase